MSQKLGLDRVIEVLEEEVQRVDSYCDDFTRDYEAWAMMEDELDRLKKILTYAEVLKKEKHQDSSLKHDITK